MPIYEYECNSCKLIFEQMQKISDPPVITCPECNKNTVKKLISATQFRLKGSGWYETDFKTANEKKRNLASTDSTVANTTTPSNPTTTATTSSTTTSNTNTTKNKKTEEA